MAALNLWSPWQEYGLGVGDHLQVWAAIPAWQRANPGQPVRLAHQGYESVAALYNWPGVEYIRADQHPDGYRHIWQASHGPPWWDWYAELGQPWDTKRLYYWPTDSERAYADLVWGSERPRVLLQWTGGMAVKMYAYWPDVLHRLRVNVRGNVIVADWRESPDAPQECWRVGARLMPRCDLRLALAIAATADLFVGFDSGPMYAALGCEVPSVGIFPVLPASQLFHPIVTPRVVPLEAHPCNAIPPDHIVTAALQLLAGAQPGDDATQFAESPHRPPVLRQPR